MELFYTELDWLFFILKIILSTTCGVAIGIERESMGKPAGIKTHSLICLGSCLFTHLSMAVSIGDPTRIAAQVVSGIGFIGAGTILHSRQRIEGLTSAALVFVNASIGMLIGSDLYIYGIIATILLLILFYLIRTKNYQQKLHHYQISAKVNHYNDIQDITQIFNTLKCNVTNKKIEKKHEKIVVNISYITSPLINHFVLSKLFSKPSIESFYQN